MPTVSVCQLPTDTVQPRQRDKAAFNVRVSQKIPRLPASSTAKPVKIVHVAIVLVNGFGVRFGVSFLHWRRERISLSLLWGVYLCFYLWWACFAFASCCKLPERRHQCHHTRRRKRQLCGPLRSSSSMPTTQWWWHHPPPARRAPSLQLTTVLRCMEEELTQQRTRRCHSGREYRSCNKQMVTHTNSAVVLVSAIAGHPRILSPVG